jgi:hypothetical protein
MKIKNILLTLTGVTLSVGSSQAAVTAYTADVNTLNLWHFDEASGSTVDDSQNTHDLGAVSGASLGSTGFSGFGNAGNTDSGTNAGFRKSGVVVSSLTGATGAFTFEAMVTLQDLGGGQQFISHEGDGAVGSRGFHFKTTGAGFLTLTNIAGGGDPASVAIPTTGDHAFVANEWFHVAVTYTGDQGAANNFNYYWTRVDSGATVANLVGTATMTDDLAGTANFLAVGNEFRGTATGSTEGLIDEVRISDIARTSDQFIFAPVPEPSTTALLGLGGLALILRRRK